MSDNIAHPEYRIGYWVYERAKEMAIPHMDLDRFQERLKICNRISYLCESPIEEIMNCAMAMICVDGEFIYWADDHGDEDLPDDAIAIGWLQKNIGPYRADCLVVVRHEGTLRNIVIEFDGHDFHERTKAQARRDKSRDRWLVANGYSVLRFTGSEIWAEPERCAEEIEAYLQQQADRVHVEHGLLKGDGK